MKNKYEIYNCNGGNSTAIITSPLSNKYSLEVAKKIFQLNPEVDQAATILDVNGNDCTFRLTGGEFCGNACLAVGGFVHKNYGIDNGSIINNVDGVNDEVHCIKIKSKCDGKTCNLIIPKEELILDVNVTKNGRYCVKMNGITHLIINESFGEKNKEIAEKEQKDFESQNQMPDVLGIIFLYNNTIDPFIWINRVKIFQNQTSCLSGSVAAAEYLIQKNKTHEVTITQPTGEAYRFMIDNKNIDITGNVQYVKSGEV